MRTFLPVLNVLGFVIALFAFTLLVPYGVAWLYLEDDRSVYLSSFALTLSAGLLLFMLTRRQRRELQARDGFLLVSLVWTALPAFATLPLLLQLPDLSFTNAYHETMSGVTTTGSTVLSGLDGLPVSINLWRCFLQWIGGMGILVLAVAILPLLGVGGSQVFKAETPGPMKDTKLTPRITETAKGLWMIYCLISIACVLAYRVGGMSWPDAFTHMFSTMSLGGLSSHDASFGYFDSPRLEAIAIFFMLVASCNFAMHFLAFRRRSLGIVLRDTEARATVGVMVGSGILVATFLVWQGVHDDWWTSLRYAMFNVVSIASTTGYANTDYGTWPMFAPVLMLLLSCFATSAGSTGAGIKMVRALVLFKQALREFIRLLHPRAIHPVRLDGRVVENNVIFAILAFMLMYGTTLIVLTMLMLFSGLDAITAFSAVVACLNNMGPGLNLVGPANNYAVLTDFQTWVCTVAMLLGRLEMFTILVLFTPAFWRK